MRVMVSEELKGGGSGSGNSPIPPTSTDHGGSRVFSAASPRPVSSQGEVPSPSRCPLEPPAVAKEETPPASGEDGRSISAAGTGCGKVDGEAPQSILSGDEEEGGKGKRMQEDVPGRTGLTVGQSRGHGPDLSTSM
ncbi:unnamed protein product [Discosporangium mesarthrocarpum]